MSPSYSLQCPEHKAKRRQPRQSWTGILTGLLRRCHQAPEWLRNTVFGKSEISYEVDIITDDLEVKRRMERCQEAIGYRFKHGNLYLLKEALNIKADLNCRLAKIGDPVQKVLLFEIAYLCTTLSRRQMEDPLTQTVASNDYMGETAIAHDIKNFMYHWQAPKQHPKFWFRLFQNVSKPRSTITASAKAFADTLEALIGAVYIDSGESWKSECRKVMKHFDIDIESFSNVVAAKQLSRGDHRNGLAQKVRRELRASTGILAERGL